MAELVFFKLEGGEKRVKKGLKQKAIECKLNAEANKS